MYYFHNVVSYFYEYLDEVKKTLSNINGIGTKLKLELEVVS